MSWTTQTLARPKVSKLPHRRPRSQHGLGLGHGEGTGDKRPTAHSHVHRALGRVRVDVGAGVRLSMPTSMRTGFAAVALRICKAAGRVWVGFQRRRKVGSL